MSINLTLVGQMITFAIFVLFTMKYIWPPILKVMEERQKKINEGLAASERGHRELELTQEHIADQIREAKVQSDEIITRADTRANQIVEEARHQANTERRHLKALTDVEIQHEIKKARQALQQEVAGLVIQGAEKIISKELSEKDHIDMIENIIKEIK